MKIDSVIFSSDKPISSITIPHFLPVTLRRCQSGFPITRWLARKIRVSAFRCLTLAPRTEPASISKRLPICQIIPLHSKHTSCLQLHQFTRLDLEGQINIIAEPYRQVKFTFDSADGGCLRTLSVQKIVLWRLCGSERKNKPSWKSRFQQLVLTVFPRDIEKQLSHSHPDIALRPNSRVIKNWLGFEVDPVVSEGRLDLCFPARTLSLPVLNVSRHIKWAIEAENEWLCKHGKFKPVTDRVSCMSLPLRLSCHTHTQRKKKVWVKQRNVQT